MDSMSIQDQLREIAGLLAAARGSDPTTLKSLTTTATRRAVALRNGLGDQLHAAPNGGRDPHVEATLQQTNTLLSLLAGLANPIAGIQWGYLDQAQQLVAEMGTRG